MITQQELELVYRKSLIYPQVHKWGWHDGPLSQKEVLVHPGFG